MPQKINPKKTDLSVSIGATLRGRLVRACEEDEKSLSEAIREAAKKWLDARDKKRWKDKQSGKD